MDWSFTDEQKELRRTAKRFVDEELRPVADEIDKRHEIPRSLIETMAELGFLGVVFPEEYDGAGMGETGYCILQEEISRACACRSCRRRRTAPRDRVHSRRIERHHALRAKKSGSDRGGQIRELVVLSTLEGSNLAQ